MQIAKRIQSLMEMGFTREHVEEAVRKFATDEQALEWLFKQNEALYSDEPKSTNVNLQSNDNNDNNENVQTIMQMGFSREQAQNALEMTNNDVEQAISVLLDNM
jgi:uncharacterized UBP type Zn finger protein